MSVSVPLPLPQPPPVDPTGLPPLATLADLALRLTQPLPTGGPNGSRADAALTDASAAIRAYTGQELTLDTTTTWLPVVRPGVVRLPQAPVIGVVSVVDRQGVGVAWDYRDRHSLVVAAVLGVYLEVNYTHGYEEMPQDIVAVTCNIAGRALFSGPESSGLTQESITNYSVSYGAISAAGPVGLFESERMILDRYRLPVGPIRMTQ